jgi:8-oxo-dGTP pyrophosphatase MutT (NUDIX family)
MSEAAIVEPRRAASVILVRDSPFEVLMVKRNERGPFASAFVFPGGVVDRHDYSESWLPHLTLPADIPDDERALRIAACRETWEEVAILPGEKTGMPARDGSEQQSFYDCVARTGVRLTLSDLVLFSHWITPTFALKRFDTYFYICQAWPGNLGRCDGMETVALEWIEPRQALRSAERGDRSFLLPTLENLKLLAASESCAVAIESARHRSIVPITPRRVIVGDKVTFTILPSTG